MGTLDENLVEESSEHATKEWTDQVDWHVHHLLGWCVGVGVTVVHSLEEGLDEANGWVDATSRDA